MVATESRWAAVVAMALFPGSRRVPVTCWLEMTK